MSLLHRAFAVAAVATAALLPAAAQAQSLSDTVAGIQVSTLGYGIVVGKSVAPLTDVRITTGALAYNRSVSSDGVDYNGTLQLHNVSLLLDVHPLNNPFHITGGVVFGNDHIDVVANAPNGTYTINGTTYPASQAGAIFGTAKLGSASPYLGVGVSPPHRLGVYFVGDAGIAFRSVSTSLTATGPIASDPTFQSNLAAARNQFNNNVGWLKTYPVVSIGLAARF